MLRNVSRNGRICVESPVRITRSTRGLLARSEPKRRIRAPIFFTDPFHASSPCTGPAALAQDQDGDR